MFQVRQFAGAQFACNVQQDVFQFLSALCMKPNIVRGVLEHKLLSTICCTTCNATRTTDDINFIVSLPLPASMKTALTVQDLITSVYSRWRNIEGPCDSCGVDILNY